MNFEETQKIKSLISDSTILSQVEKAEWSQLLPSMSNSQIADLVKILQSRPANPIPTELKPASSSIYNQVDINEKELTGVVPMDEKELPAPVPVKNITAAPAPAGMPQPVSDPQELQRRVEQIVREMSNKNAGDSNISNRRLEVPEDLQREQDPALVRRFETARQSAPTPKPPEEIQFHIPQDFEKLTPTMLHGKDANLFLRKLFESVIELSKKEKFYEILDYLDNSPLHRVYVETGIAMLNDESPDRDRAYEKIVQSLQARGDDFLNRTEFEAMADFRSHIEKFFV